MIEKLEIVAWSLEEAIEIAIDSDCEFIKCNTDIDHVDHLKKKKRWKSYIGYREDLMPYNQVEVITEVKPILDTRKDSKINTVKYKKVGTTRYKTVYYGLVKGTENTDSPQIITSGINEAECNKKCRAWVINNDKSVIITHHKVPLNNDVSKILEYKPSTKASKGEYIFYKKTKLPYE